MNTLQVRRSVLDQPHKARLHGKAAQDTEQQRGPLSCLNALQGISLVLVHADQDEPTGQRFHPAREASAR
jgi:hypothetical protein